MSKDEELLKDKVINQVGQPMQARIQQWNQQLAVCIPEAIATQIHLEAGMDVDIEVVDGKLTLLPTVKEYNLNHLLAEITCDNTHAAMDIDGAMGKEAW